MRAIRRHHYNRLKNTRKYYWFGHETPLSDREAGQIANTPHPCSCTGGCGHFREIEGRTMQERRFYTEGQEE